MFLASGELGPSCSKSTVACKPDSHSSGIQQGRLSAPNVHPHCWGERPWGGGGGKVLQGLSRREARRLMSYGDRCL